MTDQIVREMEAEMDMREQAAERFNVAVADHLEYIWERCASPLTAEKLAADYEICINDMGQIIAAVSYARRTGDKEFVADCLIGLVDRELRKIAEYEVKEDQ